MLTVTPAAAAVVTAILQNPDLPADAGMVDVLDDQVLDAEIRRPERGIHYPAGKRSTDDQTDVSRRDHTSDSTSMRIASSVAAMSWSLAPEWGVSRNSVSREPSPSASTCIHPR